MGRRAKFWGKCRQVTISDKQMQFAFALNEYRRSHNITLEQMARICSLYGEPQGVKFHFTELSCYELLKKAPSKSKYDVLCMVLNANNNLNTYNNKKVA